MAITALPQSTIHLLGSSQTLTTTTSLVKELIDNAIDAKATSVDVLLSRNTLDKIQVRDNGHGIQQEDLDALGRRGHTSKLRSFEELRSIGGITLGFRGEALASAVQLGDVSVTTRTDGEAVATTVVLHAPGGILHQSKTSHPVGTTICVLNFMSKLPVRKQTALKCASRTLAKTKELLQVYALARPSIRFSLKVEKEAKGSWTFAPRSNDGVKEAVCQVVGKEASLQCMSKPLIFAESGKSGTDHFEIDVFLPRPDAEIFKIGRGQYLSIDSRPVSHEKGTMKKIVSLYKSYLKAAFEETTEIKNPFIRLDIKCPTASYDPNVEPAKDDVLFGNERLLLDSFETFFEEIYGKQKAPAITPKPSLKGKVDNFELLLARQPEELSRLVQSRRSPSANINPGPQSGESAVLQSSNPPLHHIKQIPAAAISPGLEEDPFHESGKTRGSWGVDMSRDFVEILGESELHTRGSHSHPCGPARHPSPQSDEGSVNSLKPWVIARMTAPLHPSAKAVSSGHMAPDGIMPELSPQPRLSRGRRQSNEAINQKINIYLEQTASALADDGNGIDDILGSAGQSTGTAATAIGGDLYIPNEGLLPRVQRQNDFISARHMNETFPMTPPDTQRPNAPKKGNGLNKPFAAPQRITENAESYDGWQQMTLATAQRQNDKLQCERDRHSRSELEWAMEYEHNKEAASHKRRQGLRAARKQAREVENEPEIRNRLSPHKNRYNAALAALEADPPSSQNNPIPQPVPKTSMPHTDPRSYLMRQQVLAASSGSASKLTRAKSVKLPLERIPEQSKTHMLLVNVLTNTSKINKLTQAMASHDLYIARGVYSSGLELSTSATKELSRDIQASVEAWLDKNGEKQFEVEYTLENLNKIKV